MKKLKPSYIANTGRFPADKGGGSVQYESFLERDFLAVLDDDPEVSSIKEYALQVDWIDQTGIGRIYTPDVLVEFNTGARPCIYEVKSREEILGNFEFLKFKYRAVSRILRSKGYRFRLVTEKHISGPYSENIVFLKKYKKGYLDKFLFEDLCELLSVGPHTVSDAVAALCNTFEDKVDMLSLIWVAVANRRINVDLSERLSNKSVLTILEAVT